MASPARTEESPRLSSPDAWFSALGDGTRRRIFERVARAPSSVSEIAKGLPVSRPAVSQHLKALTEAGLVRSEAQGTKRIYRMEAKTVAAMRRWLDSMWTDALDAFAQAVENEAASDDKPSPP